MRILVVDDDQHLLTVTTQRLISAGFEVLSTLNGYDALAIMKKSEVDVLLSDVLLPGMSGLELAHHAQRHHRWVRVILTSGVVPSESSLLVGGIPFLKKPYQFAELIAAIRQAI